MILTGQEIANEVISGRICIEPFDPNLVNPNSYNIRIGSTIKQYEPGKILDTRLSAPVRETTIPAEGLLLKPGELYLGHTIEIVGSEHFVPFIGGRSSTGRLGLFVHITAPLGDIGYRGQWTLQLKPTIPVRIYPGQEIGQMFFIMPLGPITLYKGKYRTGAGPQPYSPPELHLGMRSAAPLDPYCDAPRIFAALDYATMQKLSESAENCVRQTVNHVAGGALRLLDIGCGVGYFLEAAERVPKISTLKGIDCSASVLAFASRRLTRSLLIRDDFMSFEFGEKFDIVAAMAFLHLFPKQTVGIILQRMAELVKPGGVLVASTSIHEESTEGWEEKSSLRGAIRYRSRYQLQEWRDLFSADWTIVDEWDQDEVMNPEFPKVWHNIVARRM